MSNHVAEIVIAGLSVGSLYYTADGSVKRRMA